MAYFKTQNGHTLRRVSRWIAIRTNYNPSKRNRLAEYIRDGNGYREGQSGYDPSTGLYLDYFRWNGRTWAIDQFYRLGGVWTGGEPEMFVDTDGKLSIVDGYDSENYYDPILIELDEYGERVRVYEEV